MRRWIRRLSIGLGAAVAAVLLLWAAVLVEAHVEMRRVSKPLPGRQALDAIGAGPVAIHYVNSGTQRFSPERRGTFGGFLLAWADGRRFLVDVGMSRAGAEQFGRVMEVALGAEPIQVHGSAGEQLGGAAQRVAGVGFTHLHVDHTGGMGELCDAIGREVAVYQTPDQAERGNFGTSGGRSAVEDAGCARFEPLEGGALQPVPGFPGLVAVPAGGHTPGSTLWFANVTGTTWVLAGDITNAMANLLDDVPKSRVYSWLIVPEARGRLAELRPWLADLDADARYRVVVSHDLDAMEERGLTNWKKSGN